MSNPFDDTQSTPWGQKIENDIHLLQSQVKELDMNLGRFHTELKVNTERTNSIKADTQWLVDMFRGSKALSKLLIGAAVILGAIATVGIWLGWAHK